MGHEISKVAGFAMDNASATLTDISGSVNQVTVSGGTEQYEDTGLGDARHTFILGLGTPVTIAVNGYFNSTTRGIVLPLVNGTTVTKTIQVKSATGEYWTGESIPTDVQGSLSMGAINTWSITFQANDGLTKTSVTAVA